MNIRRTIAAAYALLCFALPVGAIDLAPSYGPVAFETVASLTSAPQGGTIQVAITLDISHPWHVNAHEPGGEFAVPTELVINAPEGFSVTEIVYPRGHKKKLEFSEDELWLYEGKTSIGVALTVAADAPVGDARLTGTLTYQACDNEKCLLPESEDIAITISVTPPTTAVDQNQPELFSTIAFGETPDAKAGAAGTFGDIFAGRGLIASFLLVFLGGLALNLTPCVYPMIPITVSYFGGQSGGGSGRTLLYAALYVLGMAVMYSTLGLIASLTGSLFGGALQNPIVVVAVALVMVTLSLSMFGLYEIQIPARLAGTAGTAKQGSVGAFLMGLTVGIVAAPCIGPFVLGLLTFVGNKADPVLGFSMFFVLALGLGLPFLILAVASGKISTLPRSGEWMDWVKRLFGFILLGMALFFLRTLIPDVVYLIGLAALFIIGGIWLGYVVKTGTKMIAINALKRTVGVLAPLFGLYLLAAPGNLYGRGDVHGIDWLAYDEQAISAAAETGRPVVIDFSAEWCIPCKELDHRTFNQPEVVTASESFVPLKADLTKSGSPEVKALREKYAISGVPTIVFIDSSGKERTDLRVTGFIPKDVFLDKIAAMHGNS